MLITILPDSAEKSATADAPKLSSYINPSTADLVLFTAYLRDLVASCNVTAAANEAGNPYAVVGAMRIHTLKLHDWLQSRLAEEERDLLLMDRLRHEAAQEDAHERLLKTDDEYADEWDELEGDEE